MTRSRLRDLDIVIGDLPVGPNNAITDVPGVLVGHTTLSFDEPRVARTGVTVVVPCDGRIHEDNVFAAYHVLNGNGEMTGLPWIDETGLLGSPVAITNTNQVGVVRDALVEHAVDRGMAGWILPVVAETYDGFLNDIDGFHVTKEHVFQALDSASDGQVAEGNVGGGTGMMCHGFKGGIGTSSRVAEAPGGPYTVGVLVQANYGSRKHLRVDGVPVGREIGPDDVPLPRRTAGREGSIIIVVATDAPLVPVQCRRLAQRATVGLARVGGVGHNSSGDIFLAFATGNHPSHDPNDDASPDSSELVDLKMLPNNLIDSLFDATAEAVEESILNALTAAETTAGFQGTAHALPLDRLQEIMSEYRR
ncbi:MAG: P1 family peptidase [SAR202 cluster bacterium]|jgi:D-aminopeptidase|nr:P1 family peptidase [SAR202 cluster bacterium]MDP6799072.1 P1 family peptidase [SAR202 cluster bacterium]|tara:strand:+ start:867 stop:1955 length:1089 start_codon:yes stop_codon:yes gene_type:complete